MAFSRQQAKLVEDTIRQGLKNKFNKYKPEPAVMPFHTRLLGRDRLVLYSFIHSLNTAWGTTIFEPVAVTLASNRFRVAELQKKTGSEISEKAQHEIQKIINNLTTAKSRADKQKEVEIIRSVCRSGKMQTVKPTKVDVYLEDNSGQIYLIDIKTAKPNKGGFKEYKEPF